MEPFASRLAQAVQRTGSAFCVGIDPHLERLPPGQSPEARVRDFAEAIIDVVADRVPAIKFQVAFFEALGPKGMQVLADLCQHARQRNVLIIADAKRNDIASTATAYAQAWMGPDAPYPADALTVSPYLGADSLDPFVAQAQATQSGLFVLLRTSNPGSKRWQDPIAPDIAAWIEKNSEKYQDQSGMGPIGAVVGATWPGEMAALRAQMPHTWFLVPGFGTQGGTAADTAPAFRPDGLGALIVGARSLTFPTENNPDWQRDPRPFIAQRLAQAEAELKAARPC